MKLTTTLVLLLLIAFTASAQTPQALNYQAIARNASGQIIPSQSIGIRFTIIDGSATGTDVYSETYTTTTNKFGLFTLAIGKGLAQTGTFPAINWATGDKFLKVEVSPGGGGNYTIQGVTQLLSVPYALYSERTHLIAGNNTINVNGNTISANYQAGNAISIAGNTIAANYQAGPGINIAGNIISSNGGQWVQDAFGIHNQAGSVAIGANSSPNIALDVMQVPTGGNSVALQLQSSDVWHTALTMLNTSAGLNRYTFTQGGALNGEVGASNFGLINHSLSKFAWVVSGATNNIGIGMNNFAPTEVPRSRLHVFSGDVNVEQIGNGIIMKSPNGQCWRVTVSNTGTFVSTAITCP